MEFTQSEIAELKAILSSRKKAKAKPSSPAGIIKLLVGPHGRVTGRVLVLKDDKPPKGHKFIADDKRVKIGLLVRDGKVVHKTGQTAVYDIVNASGVVLNTIVADPGELPDTAKGEKLVKHKS